MIDQEIIESIRAYFTEDGEIENFLYFEQFNSSKSLSKERVRTIFEDYLGIEITDPLGSVQREGVKLRIGDSPVIIWSIAQDRWLVVYDSSIDRSLRDKLSSLDNRVGWLLDVWVPSETVDRLYKEFSPEDESVTIERTWDPYYIYQNDSEIPENLRNYYADNLTEFVEQEIEFNLKTPQFMVDKALDEGVEEDLIEKSEISKSRFTYSPEDDGIRQDGAIQSPAGESSKVTVRNGGQVVHRSGSLTATQDLMTEIDSGTHLYDEFEEVIPELEREEFESGIVDTIYHNEGGVLKVTFEEKKFNEEASIKLSNLLTIGQNDVDLHGVVKRRGELWFYASTHMAYDEGEYDILFTNEAASEGGTQSPNKPAVYIKPVNATTSGLVYLYRKLNEKFDSRTSYYLEDKLPISQVISSQADAGGEE